VEIIEFIDITGSTALTLFIVGFIGGMVSGFIGSGGAFVLTPAMMSLGVPAAVAVASNMAHKFPKALVGAYKRNKYGQVDIKLGLVMGVFAEAGVLSGKHVMVSIREAFGAAGTNLYVSAVFVLVLGIVGGFVLRDALREIRGEGSAVKPPSELNRVARWVRTLTIPGTMVYFKSIDAKISFLVIAPLGFATGLLAASIAVGGFIGVPALMYIIGLSALAASATELVVAFVMGMGGSYFYALDGFVDIRLSMIILAGSLFGIQIGAIGTTYVKDHTVKLVMASIMLLVLVSRFFYIPGYLSELEMMDPVAEGTVGMLNNTGQGILAFALLFGAIMILQALYKGIREYRLTLTTEAASVTVGEAAVAEPSHTTQLSPLARFERFLVASDGSEYSDAAVREAINMANRCGAELHVMSLVAINVEHEGLGESLVKQELETKQAYLDQVKVQAKAADVDCDTHLVEGSTVTHGIVDLAEQIKADLIVMGRRGHRGLARLMLGRATARVIGAAPCNILVVPRAAHIEAQHIILATDASRSAQAAAVTATRLAQLCHAPVTVVSVTTPSHGPERIAEAELAVKQTVEHMQTKGVEVDGTVLHGQPDAQIVNIAREKNADLIITGSHGRSELERVLLGSTTERILNETPCSVLVVKGN
jgi:nucleotide-binding universal stress UspA family protein/uncharacterized membrane protein YfcA